MQPVERRSHRVAGVFFVASVRWSRSGPSWFSSSEPRRLRVVLFRVRARQRRPDYCFLTTVYFLEGVRLDDHAAGGVKVLSGMPVFSLMSLNTIVVSPA